MLARENNSITENTFLNLMEENEGKELSVSFINSSLSCQHDISKGWQCEYNGIGFIFKGSNTILELYPCSITNIILNKEDMDIECDIELETDNGSILIYFN